MKHANSAQRYAAARKRQRRLTQLAACLTLLPVLLSLFYAGRLPEEYHIRRGEGLHITSALPITASPAEAAAQTAQFGACPQTATLRLLGLFPIKNVRLRPTESVMLVPCGQPFGIRMLMGGVMVIGFGEVVSGTGHCCPAAEAGLEVGDVIVGAGQGAIGSTADLRAMAATGEPLHLTVMHAGTLREVTLTPAYSLAAGCCQTGLWVRDSAAGIGTLTYFEPETGRFGGLGHPICDPDTGELIPLAQGEADAVTISGVLRGQAGDPGQLQGYFSADAPLGTLECNSEAGIFGTLCEVPDAQPLPMALCQEVETGAAELLATLDGSTPERFSVEISSLNYTDSTQNMVIRVTDERLLERAGGIVQGMSGSPIVQNGRLVGAVTHVFVNDPSRGYGIFAENMYAYTQMTAP